MGEFSTLNAIRSVMVGTPSFCVNGLKLREHLSGQLKKLNINTGKGKHRRPDYILKTLIPRFIKRINYNFKKNC